MSDGSHAADGHDFVRSLERGLAVIGAFEGSGSGLTTSEVAASVGLTRAAARRFLLTLVELGYVRLENRVYRLTPRVLELRRSYLAGSPLPDVARPYQDALVERARESSSLALLDGDDIVYVGHVSARRVLTVVVGVGARDPAFATSLGRVLLAGQSDEWLESYFERLELRQITPRTIPDVRELREELLRVRDQGWAFVDGELEEGLRALAAPVRDVEGRVAAAVNIVFHPSRWSSETVQDTLLPPLLEAAAAISSDLAEVPPLAGARRPATATVGKSHDESEVVRELRGARGIDFVQSLARGLAVVRAFEAGRPSLTTSEIAASVGLTRAAARRFLLTLAKLDYVRPEGRSFSLTPRVLELGRSYLAGLTLPELALPHQTAFVAEARESSSLAVLEGDDVVYIAHVPALRPLAVVVAVGARDPAFATASGRVLLAGQANEWLDAYLARLKMSSVTTRTIGDTTGLRAELERVRLQGWSLVDGELEEGLRALAAPIRDRDGRVVAAINVAAHASRWGAEAMLESLLPKLLRASTAIESDVHVAGLSGTSMAPSPPF